MNDNRYKELYDKWAKEEEADNTLHTKIGKWLTEQSKGKKIVEMYGYGDVVDLIFQYTKEISESPINTGGELLAKTVVDYADVIVKQEAEIKRLKGLIEEAYVQSWRDAGMKNTLMERWIKFKAENNL